jgi:hypothetical protein
MANVKAMKRLVTYIGQLFITSFKVSYPPSMVSRFEIEVELTPESLSGKHTVRSLYVWYPYGQVKNKDSLPV